MERNAFYNTILQQIEAYLKGSISKDEYYDIAEPFYSRFASEYDNPLFHQYFLGTVENACTIYIEEPGLSPEDRERLFLKVMYEELQKPEYR